VVQHRPHPYFLLGPHAYSALADVPGIATTGHELRELLACALHDGKALTWTVQTAGTQLILRHSCGLTGIPAQGLSLPASGSKMSLHPVDVTWDERILGSFPVLVCADSPPARRSWAAARVRRRTAPMTVEISDTASRVSREQYPLGGIVPGETVLVHTATGRVLGRLLTDAPRSFDPDAPQVLRVASLLPKGGAIVADSSGGRGLLTTNQALRAGQRIAAVQIDIKPRGPVWAAIGSPLP
jgi:hypothetical protein